MKLFIQISIYFSTLYSFGKETIDYKIFFKDEIIEANNYLKNTSQLFDHSCKKYKHSKKEITAIIYPELLRYNYFKDFIETSSLELIYVNFGPKVADFSIGHFQMKPSFVEQIEKQIQSDESLFKKYKSLIIKGKNKRLVRINRLKSTHWQLIYLHAFVDLCQIKFPFLKKESQNNKIHFLAACYNIGFNYSLEHIKKRSHLEIFPFGIKYNEKQCCYSAISWSYFNSKN